MSMYLTYVEYQNMGGTLDATNFNNLSFDAETTVDWYTFNRLHKMTEYSMNVKRLMYRLIEIANLKEQALSLGNASNDGTSTSTVASQSNDGFSVQYNILSAVDALKVSEQEREMLVNHYLSNETDALGRRLLYRGLYPDE